MTDATAAMYSIALWNESRRPNDPSGHGFWNYGYWDTHTTDPKQASNRLFDHLVSRLPTHAVRILDVAFGKGESTRRLCELVGSENVVGINIAQDQIDSARSRGVKCRLHLMDAVEMDFSENKFDAILCIEAAFHFRSRVRFVEQAHAILRPGGRLIMSDLLFRSSHGLSPEIFPAENEVRSLEEYRRVFTNGGFPNDCVEIERTTERQMVPYFVHMATAMGALQFQTEDKVQKTLSRADMWTVWFMLSRLLNVTDCVVVSATKR